MTINIIAIGNKNPKWLDLAIDFYKLRLPKKYCLIKEIPYLKQSKKLDKDLIKTNEGKLLLKNCTDGIIISLVPGKNQLDSFELAKKIKNLQSNNKNINFLIGGAYGLSTNCIKDSKIKISLSALTFSHYLAKLVLLESIYRSWTILTNHPYNK